MSGMLQGLRRACHVHEAAGAMFRRCFSTSNQTAGAGGGSQLELSTALKYCQQLTRSVQRNLLRRKHHRGAT